MNTLAKLAIAIDPTCVRLWTHGETTSVTQMEDSGYDERLYAHKHSLILNAERCDRLYSEWAASDYEGGFYEYAYADMISSMMTDHGRMVRAVNHINERINKAPIKHLFSNIEF